MPVLSHPTLMCKASIICNPGQVEAASEFSRRSQRRGSPDFAGCEECEHRQGTEPAPVGGGEATCVAAAFLHNCRQYRCTRSSPFAICDPQATAAGSVLAFFRSLFS